MKAINKNEKLEVRLILRHALLIKLIMNYYDIRYIYIYYNLGTCIKTQYIVLSFISVLKEANVFRVGI